MKKYLSLVSKKARGCCAGILVLAVGNYALLIKDYLRRGNDLSL